MPSTQAIFPPSRWAAAAALRPAPARSISPRISTRLRAPNSWPAAACSPIASPVSFAEKFPEYANASGPFLAREPGIRESYRWKGRYTLTADDLVNATEFPDTVAYATWPIELREDTRGPKFRFFKQPVPAPIPLRALTSAEINGVFFAGRCISATHEALASLRVMGTCFATGQAAGNAAVEFLSRARPA